MEKMSILSLIEYKNLVKNQIEMQNFVFFLKKKKNTENGKRKKCHYKRKNTMFCDYFLYFSKKSL